MNQRIKKIGFTIGKFAISGAAVYYLVHSLSEEDKGDIANALSSANKGWLLLAFLVFNLSKIISAIRLNGYFRCLQLQLSEWFNLKLYYLGMFYNLFLPGGIGGDGYKVYLLHKRYATAVKGLISTTILDRLSGVVVLGFLALLLALASSVEQIVPMQNLWLMLGAIAAFPVFWWVHKKFFRTFQPAFFSALGMGFGVQLSQLLSGICLLLAISAPGSYVDYLTLFLVSSVAAVLPFTIGGVGARELVFAEGVALFATIENCRSEALAFSILFFVITAISSFIGVFYVIKLKASR